MSEESYHKENSWEVPGSDDEMEYDLWKRVDNKLIACFDALTKQKTLKVSPALYGRPTLASHLQSQMELKQEKAMINEPPKQMVDNNDSSIFDTFDYRDDGAPDNMRKRSFPSGPATTGRQPNTKKASLNNVMNNMMRHKRLESMGARPQVVKNMYQAGPGIPPPAEHPYNQAPVRHPRSLTTGSVAQDITQNVMAQSRSINESMASLNMPRPPKNMPLTTPQPTQLGQSPQPNVDIPRSPSLSSPNTIFTNNGSSMAAAQNMGPPNQTMIASNMLVRGPRPDQQRRTQPMQQQAAHYALSPHPDNMSLQQQQQLYQRMPGMYKSAHGLTLIQGNSMAPRMVYNPVSGQTIMTTQHSGMMGPGQSVMGNNVLVSRSGMMTPQTSMIPGMGPAPPNMSATMLQNQVMSQQHKMMGMAPDARQIALLPGGHSAMAQLPPGMIPQNLPPNQTISKAGGGMSPHLQGMNPAFRPAAPNTLSPGDKSRQSQPQLRAKLPNAPPPGSHLTPNQLVSSPSPISSLHGAALTQQVPMSPNTIVPPPTPGSMTPVRTPTSLTPPQMQTPNPLVSPNNPQSSPITTDSNIALNSNITLNTAGDPGDTDKAGPMNTS